MKTVLTSYSEISPSICTAYKGPIVCLDCGHDALEAGKRSWILSDGRQLLEYKFNREIAHLIKAELDKLNVQCIITTEEENIKVSLTERANRINKIVKQYGIDNVIAISIHADAYGNTWNGANGWSIYTSNGQTKSDSLAKIFAEEAQKILPKYNRKFRGIKEENFTILVKTNCPTVLIENLFYTNEEECKFLLSDEGKKCCVDIIINAIKQIINKKSGS